MKKAKTKTILAVAVAMVAIAAVAAAPAIAKDSKKPTSHKSAAAAAAAMGHVPQVQAAPKAGQHDDKPGPAWRTVGGTVKSIDGSAYVVEESVDNYRGEAVSTNEVRIYVGKDTKRLHGNKKVGDTVRAEITRGGFANSIQ